MAASRKRKKCQTTKNTRKSNNNNNSSVEKFAEYMIDLINNQNLLGQIGFEDTVYTKAIVKKMVIEYLEDHYNKKISSENNVVIFVKLLEEHYENIVKIIDMSRKFYENPDLYRDFDNTIGKDGLSSDMFNTDLSIEEQIRLAKYGDVCDDIDVLNDADKYNM